MKVYVVNGAPGAGKTTFEHIVQRLLGKNKCIILSTIDYVKDMAIKLGWDGEKTPENRKFLSNLKALLLEWDDSPYTKILQEVSEIKRTNIYTDCIVFIDSREPEEIERLKNDLCARTIIVRRGSAEAQEASNSSDANVLNYKYDYTISNNRDIYNLIELAAVFLKWENIKPGI